jgi:hypothetical protein
MKKINFIIALLLLTTVLKAQNITGNWTGYLVVKESRIKIVIHIQRKEGKLNSTFDSPDQNAFGLKIDKTTLTGNKLSLDAASLGIQYEGNLSKRIDSIKGNWKQGGQTVPLVMGREKKVAIIKP